MLANLLPGIREIRAPLAAGYIWLITLWIISAEYIPKKGQAEGAWKSIYQLSAATGTAATLAAASFAAYLVGCLLEIRARSIVHWFTISEWWWSLRHRLMGSPISGQLDDPRMLRWTENPNTARGVPAMDSLLMPDDSYTALRRPDWGSRASRSALIDLAIHIVRIRGRSVNLLAAMGRFGDELDQLSIRLQARNSDLYGTYDRTVAEADFRVNVGFSASILATTLAAKSTPEVLLLVPVAWFLIMRGQQKAREANDVLIQAVVSGELESTVLTSELPPLVTTQRAEDPSLETRRTSIEGTPDGSGTTVGQ
ncbi:hypothetical protein ACGFZK_33795 [Streptomyces sp. NPDC048257]|uniref:hypothetical protein n=1 Tax=Streptomyces sp. NPDC048257 TaxID=3365526 RepID=UPI0037222153